MGGLGGAQPPPGGQTNMQVDVSMCLRSHVRQLDLEQSLKNWGGLEGAQPTPGSKLTCGSRCPAVQGHMCDSWILNSRSKMGGVWGGAQPLPREQTHMQVDVSMCSRSHVRQLDLDQVFNITRAKTGSRTPFLSKRRPWGMPGQALGPFWGSLSDPETPSEQPGVCPGRP